MSACFICCRPCFCENFPDNVQIFLQTSRAAEVAPWKISSYYACGEHSPWGSKSVEHNNCSGSVHNNIFTACQWVTVIAISSAISLWCCSLLHLNYHTFSVALPIKYEDPESRRDPLTREAVRRFKRQYQSPIQLRCVFGDEFSCAMLLFQ